MKMYEIRVYDENIYRSEKKVNYNINKHLLYDIKILTFLLILIHEVYT